MHLASLAFLLPISLFFYSSPSFACPYLSNGNRKMEDERRPVHKVARSRKQRRKLTKKKTTQRELQESESLTDVLERILLLIGELLASFTSSSSSSSVPQAEDVQNAIASAKEDIQDILNNDLSNELVRLAFHDCVGGICDGCVDMSNPDNSGLNDPIEDMEGIVDDYAEFLTRADIWVLGAYTALERQQNNNDVSFDLEFVGRPTCDDATGGPDRSLPSAHLTTRGLIDFFGDQFSFDERETTAIMGAHTLGRAVPENSGFNGQGGWVPQENNLNNQFYDILLGNGNGNGVFQQQLQDNSDRPQFPDQFLWRRNGGDGGGGGGGNRRRAQGGPGSGGNRRRAQGGEGGGLFMLNADMALRADTEGFIDSSNGAVTCTLDDTCPDSSLLEFTNEFADSNSAWLSAFHDAYIKMTNVGCEGVCRAI